MNNLSIVEMYHDVPIIRASKEETKDEVYAVLARDFHGVSAGTQLYGKKIIYIERGSGTDLSFILWHIPKISKNAFEEPWKPVSFNNLILIKDLLEYIQANQHRFRFLKLP
ncbi:MAG: hypothetical protein PHV30_08600 [Candidatus Margulisbacteria bacterium]|nr:hypothetical protein [Candidatus Margulisiibacteriota bacterium]